MAGPRRSPTPPPPASCPQPRRPAGSAVAVDADARLARRALPRSRRSAHPLADEVGGALARAVGRPQGQGRARRARQSLILHYAPLVTAVAGRVGMRLPRTVEHADLVSYGMFGLIDAIEKYQTDRAVKFESYASSRIRGAIIDELRAMDWVPRSVRTKARAVDRAYAELEAQAAPRADRDRDRPPHAGAARRAARRLLAAVLGQHRGARRAARRRRGARRWRLPRSTRWATTARRTRRAASRTRRPRSCSRVRSSSSASASASSSSCTTTRA